MLEPYWKKTKKFQTYKHKPIPDRKESDKKIKRINGSMEDENALEFLNDEELLKSIDDIFNDNEKELDKLIQRTDKQLKDFLEK